MRHEAILGSERSVFFLILSVYNICVQYFQPITDVINYYYCTDHDSTNQVEAAVAALCYLFIV